MAPQPLAAAPLTLLAGSIKGYPLAWRQVRVVKPRQQAVVFQQLLAAQQAGLPLALSLPLEQAKADADWVVLGEQQGYWSPAWSSQLRLAQNSGQLESLLLRFSRRMQDRAQIYDGWRKGLSLPIAAMTLATLLAPVTTLFGHAANWSAFLQQALALWCVVLGGLGLLRWLWLAPQARPWRVRLIRACPWRFWARLGWAHNLRLEPLIAFSMAYAAGRPMSEAAASAAKVAAAAELEDHWRQASKAISAGASLHTQTLAGAMVDRQQRQWIQAGEEAGALEQELWRSVEHSQSLILEKAEAWATWCPRALLLLGPSATYTWLRMAVTN